MTFVNAPYQRDLSLRPDLFHFINPLKAFIFRDMPYELLKQT